VARPPSEPSADDLAGHLADEMGRRWRAGERPLAEDYLARHPDLCDRPDAALELIYEELCLRQELGPPAAPEDVLGRFPHWRPQLLALLDCHRLLAGGGGPRFPEAGEALDGFRLLAELGRGAHGRVFLATDPDLADRPVVLKLVPRASREHLSLARLQHTHVVPVYSVRDDEARGLRALCMPYFGGVTLERVLAALQLVPPAARTGAHLPAALRDAGPTAEPPALAQGPACRLLERLAYPEAVAWLGAGLADALGYAHERGLVHLDLKPANVLLAADGVPMLLDFHLARAPLPPGEPPPPWLGGTPAYMAPEHRAALDAVRDGRPVAAGVDGRADLFALGLVVAELLTGTRPPAGAPAAWLRRHNPRVSPGLADVVARCLAADPDRRYPTAAGLADDLRRHLADRPLLGVRNRSLPERWRKWRRRRPAAAALAALTLAAAFAGGAFTAHARRQADHARAALDGGREQLRQLRHAEAAGSFRHGLDLTEDVPLTGGLRAELADGLRRAELGQGAGELHALAEQLRTAYGAEALNPAAARAVEAQCRALWQRRGLILGRLADPTDPDLGRQVRGDLMELAVLGADLRVRLAAGGEAARREALDVLGEAEALFGPGCVLARERQAHAAALGLTELARAAGRQADALGPATAWEHVAVGRGLTRADRLDEAEDQFARALALAPQDFWANFHAGSCALRRGRPTDAVAAFTACVALAPERAWCYHNRGRAFEELGRPDDALRDYGRALRLDPGLAAAALNRGVLHHRQGRDAEALADLARALAAGADPAAVHYDTALVHLARGDRPAARASLDAALRHDPRHADAHALAERLR
jgi:serine/threonine protein kinase/Flp pilus assembly protein TadD